MPDIIHLVKSFLLKKPKLYVLIRSLREINSADIYKLLIGYYENDSDEKVMSIILENSSKFLTTSAVYDISFGELENCGMGFCALLFWTIWQIYFADRIGFIPMVTWGNNCHYYEKELSDITDNVFEYYFCSTFNKPNMKKEAVRKNYPICRANTNKRTIKKIGIKRDSYFETDQEGLLIHAEIYKKYIRLNSETDQYLKNELSKIFIRGKILGVHVRGTDFKKGLKNHPVATTFDEYLMKAKELFSIGKYDKIFLATDDIEALDLFKKKFEDKLVIYSDAFRTEGDRGPHSTESNRPLHHYRLGLEVLRDVYTLANCDGLVCGLSNVSFAARYINLALEKKYEDLIILDNGITKIDSQTAKKAKSQLLKKKKYRNKKI